MVFGQKLAPFGGVPVSPKWYKKQHKIKIFVFADQNESKKMTTCDIAHVPEIVQKQIQKQDFKALTEKKNDSFGRGAHVPETGEKTVQNLDFHLR